MSPMKYIAIKLQISYSLEDVLKKISELTPEIDLDEFIDAFIYVNKDHESGSLDTSSAQEMPKFDISKLAQPQYQSQADHIKPTNTNSISTTNIVQGFSMPILSQGLLYLNLSGNQITQTEWMLPTSLILLNLSHNLITDLRSTNSLVNLLYINLANNQLASVEGISGFKGLLEIYIDRNMIENIGALCRLINLKIIDASYNLIEKYEDIAPLALNTKMIALKLKGNKVTETPNYNEFAATLLPKVRFLDPEDVVIYSLCPLPDLIFPETKSIRNHRKNHSLPTTPIHIYSINIHESPIPHKLPKKYFSELADKIDLSQASVSTILNSSKMSTPKTRTRQNSPIPVVKKKFSKSTTVSPQSTVKVSIKNCIKTPNRTPARTPKRMVRSNLVSPARMSELEESCLNFSTASKVSVITNETITNSQKIGYGNPVAAMMIKPAQNGRNRVKSMV